MLEQVKSVCLLSRYFAGLLLVAGTHVPQVAVLELTAKIVEPICNQLYVCIAEGVFPSCLQVCCDKTFFTPSFLKSYFTIDSGSGPNPIGNFIGAFHNCKCCCCRIHSAERDTICETVSIYIHTYIHICILLHILAN